MPLIQMLMLDIFSFASGEPNYDIYEGYSKCNAGFPQALEIMENLENH